MRVQHWLQWQCELVFLGTVLCVDVRGGGVPCEYDGDECGWGMRVRGGLQRGGGCDELGAVLHVVVCAGGLPRQF